MKNTVVLCTVLGLSAGLSGTSEAGSTSDREGRLILTGYWIRNNTHGAAYSPSGTQSIENFNSSGTISWKSVYNWPLNNQPYRVKAYPAIIKGASWNYTNQPAHGTTGLPVAVYQNKTFISSGSYSFANRGTQNAAFDIWLDNAATRATYNPKEEVMVWLGNYGAGPIGSFVKYTSLNGTGWNVSSNGFTHSFLRASNTTSWSNFDLRSFIHDAAYNISYGGAKLLTANDYIIGLEFGTEIFATNGQGTFNCSYRLNNPQ